MHEIPRRWELQMMESEDNYLPSNDDELYLDTFQAVYRLRSLAAKNHVMHSFEGKLANPGVAILDQVTNIPCGGDW